MIYTITFNPSLDYVVSVENFKLGVVNRTSAEMIFPGGKGINVSMVLKNLGLESTALGFFAGFTGKEIEDLLKKRDINMDFIYLNEGNSRINIKLKSTEESEINGKGPKIDDEAIGKLYSKLDKLKAGDYLVLAGSIPDTMPDSSYSDIMARLQGKGVNIVVDATKELLVNVLKYRPFLVKPNNYELGEIYGVTIESYDDVITYGRKLQEDGAKNVLVSMAEKGAVLLSESGQVYVGRPPKGKVINSVGAGDSMVAGFMAGYFKSQDCLKAFEVGICAGSASAFSSGLATKEEVERLLNEVEIDCVSRLFDV